MHAGDRHAGADVDDVLDLTREGLLIQTPVSKLEQGRLDQGRNAARCGLGIEQVDARHTTDDTKSPPRSNPPTKVGALFLSG